MTIKSAGQKCCDYDNKRCKVSSFSNAHHLLSLGLRGNAGHHHWSFLELRTQTFFFSLSCLPALASARFASFCLLPQCQGLRNLTHLLCCAPDNPRPLFWSVAQPSWIDLCTLQPWSIWTAPCATASLHWEAEKSAGLPLFSLLPVFSFPRFSLFLTDPHSLRLSLAQVRQVFEHRMRFSSSGQSWWESPTGRARQNANLRWKQIRWRSRSKIPPVLIRNGPELPSGAGGRY